MFVVFEALDDVDRPWIILQDSRAVRLAMSLSRFDNTTRKDNLGKLTAVREML